MEGFKPPASVAEQAAKGLEYRRRSGKGGLSSQDAGKEGVGSGVQRATNLKNRDNISPETIDRMLAFFSRHEKNKSIAPENKNTPWEDAGYVAWLLWGGDPGRAWAKKMKKQMEKKGAETFGPHTPLLDLPQAKVKYRVKSDSTGILVAAYIGNKRIAWMDAYAESNVTRIACASDLYSLLEQFPTMENTSKPRFVLWGVPVPNVKALYVSGANIPDPAHRGLGIGKALYRAVLKEWFAKVGPFFFMPHKCSIVGSTSDLAQRVWASLEKQYPHSGDVLAILFP